MPTREVVFVRLSAGGGLLGKGKGEGEEAHLSKRKRKSSRSVFPGKHDRFLSESIVDDLRAASANVRRKIPKRTDPSRYRELSRPFPLVGGPSLELGSRRRSLLESRSRLELVGGLVVST